MFGTNNKIAYNSFFKIAFDNIYQCLMEYSYFDGVLFDIFKIVNEKFTIDYVKNY